MMKRPHIRLTQVVEKMDLKSLTPEVPIDDIVVEVADITRPKFQLTGYFGDYKEDRIQILGEEEGIYLTTLDDERKEYIFEKMMAAGMPAMIVSKGRDPEPIMIEKAIKYNIPVFTSSKPTAALVAEIIRWLNVRLAPCTTVHGVLVDCYGVGVLLMGESGIGKSEAAIELIKRGHRLVTDDVVEIHKVSEVTLVGTAPDITRHFIELRGIGVLDVKTMFGVQSVLETSSIDLIIKLKEWDQEEDYDRLGLNDDYMEILGNEVVCHSIPIRPGRNLAVIVESAAVNYRQKQMGYNAAHELYKRVQDNIEKRRRQKELQSE